MTDLQKLKLLLGISDTSKDSILTLILELAADDFKALTGADTANESTVIKMAIVKYNLLGSEGLQSQSYSGLSENYSGYGEDLLKEISRYRKLKVL